ncbi:transcriptional regulator with XRE-family HTH domain [Actinoplanes tereljensis]|uniref:DNA-binding protein n=1 Tax=Paractinoplanes tereljensis TaxID=571912 RepID=A0A919TS88_9ACTN|nr:helix-turn-helix transcriptional regulator [Actinoplanes tereljensis]GIF20286.1 DNA-binding protein [Actinoplanes tereljensis]
MDRARLADYLRTRREALQPEDVGLPRGPRRRTRGLRREEVAVLSDMSIDYYTRLEQPRGPQPSPPMLGALARGMRLSMEERDHLFQLAGYATPARTADGEHVNPGMLRIFDGLRDAAAQVVTHVGETLLQTPLHVALMGDAGRYTGLARSFHYRWFTDPASRLIYPLDERDEQSRLIVADLLTAYTRKSTKAQAIVGDLRARSPEFAALWRQHPVAGTYCGPVRLEHPEVGELELHCQRLIDPDQSQQLVVYTGAHEKLRLLSVIGPATPGTTSSR